MCVLLMAYIIAGSCEMPNLYTVATDQRRLPKTQAITSQVSRSDAVTVRWQVHSAVRTMLWREAWQVR
jgi:hypothetical protein